MANIVMSLKNGMLFMVAGVTFLRWWRPSVGGVLTWVTWLVC